MQDRVYVIERIFYEKIFRKKDRRQQPTHLYTEYPYAFIKLTDAKVRNDRLNGLNKSQQFDSIAESLEKSSI